MDLPPDEIARNIVRLLAVAGILLTQVALLYSLSVVMNTNSSEHRSDCPFARARPWAIEVNVPNPAACPHCVWARVYTRNHAAELLGWVILCTALLSLVYLIR